MDGCVLAHGFGRRHQGELALGWFHVRRQKKEAGRRLASRTAQERKTNVVGDVQVGLFLLMEVPMNEGEPVAAKGENGKATTRWTR